MMTDGSAPESEREKTPLELNPAEGRWLAAIRGPLGDGWFSFGLHGNPPPGVPVEVLDEMSGGGSTPPDPKDKPWIGWRTQIIRESDGKEGWMIRSTDGTRPRLGGLTYWRPRQDQPIIRVRPVEVLRWWQIAAGAFIGCLLARALLHFLHL